MTERERWAVVAFMKTLLPTLTPAEYRAERARLMPADAGAAEP
jgi:hypothetical protein